jgi:hypothetical protein
MAETENKYVKPITIEQRKAIIDKSVQSLSARPSSNPTEMKKRFVQPIVNTDGHDNPCLADEVDRVANEADQAFRNVDASITDLKPRMDTAESDIDMLETALDKTIADMPLFIPSILSIQVDIPQGYTNSLSAKLFNKPAEINKTFWFTNIYNKTVKGVFAKITGELNDKGFYPFEAISVVVLHDGDLDKTVDSLQERMGVAESDIDKLEGDVSSNNKQITELDGRVDALQTRLDTFSLYEIVDSLPTNGDANKLYLVPATSTENGNILEEWLWANNKWELVGTKKVDIDLTPYAKKDDVIAKTEKGKEKGVATLDEKGKVPKDQLPDDLIFGENGLSEEWKLIGETTVEPDSDGGLPQGVYFSLNSDGNPFKLKRAKVIVLTDTTKSDYVYPKATANVQIKGALGNDKTGWHRATWVSGFPQKVNTYAKILFDVEVIDSIAYATGNAANALNGYTIGEFSDSKAVYGGLGVPLATEWIEEIGVSVMDGHLTEGTKVLVYGIPADAISNGGSGGSSLPEGFNPDDYVKNDEFDDKFKQSATDTKKQWNETEKYYAREKIGAVSEAYVDDNKGTKLYRHYVYLSDTMVSDGHRYKYLVFESLSYEKFVYSPDDSLLLLDVKQLSKVYGLRLETEADEDGNAFSMPILRVVASYEENDNSIAVVFVEAEQNNVITLWTDTEIGYVGDMNYTVQEL